MIHEEQWTFSLDDSFVLGQHLHENSLLKTHLHFLYEMEYVMYVRRAKYKGYVSSLHCGKNVRSFGRSGVCRVGAESTETGIVHFETVTRFVTIPKCLLQVSNLRTYISWFHVM